MPINNSCGLKNLPELLIGIAHQLPRGIVGVIALAAWVEAIEGMGSCSVKHPVFKENIQRLI